MNAMEPRAELGRTKPSSSATIASTDNKRIAKRSCDVTSRERTNSAIPLTRAALNTSARYSQSLRFIAGTDPRQLAQLVDRNKACETGKYLGEPTHFASPPLVLSHEAFGPCS